MIFNRGQAGDTIVEVMIAVAVVSSIIGGTFVVVNRSSNNVRKAQERTEALKIVETQIESLKALATKGSTVFDTTQTILFCLKSDNTPVEFKPPNTAASISSLPSLGTDPLSNYPAECKTGTVPGGYNLAISPDGSTHTYTVSARWATLGGPSNDEVKIIYRVKP